MHVVLHRLPRRFLGGGKQRPDIDVEADIGEGRGDHLLAAVVAVLADLGDQNARPSICFGAKRSSFSGPGRDSSEPNLPKPSP